MNKSNHLTNNKSYPADKLIRINYAYPNSPYADRYEFPQGCYYTTESVGAYKIFTKEYNPDIDIIFKSPQETLKFIHDHFKQIDQTTLNSRVYESLKIKGMS